MKYRILFLGAFYLILCNSLSRIGSVLNQYDYREVCACIEELSGYNSVITPALVTNKIYTDRSPDSFMDDLRRRSRGTMFRVDTNPDASSYIECCNPMCVGPSQAILKTFIKDTMEYYTEYKSMFKDSNWDSRFYIFQVYTDVMYVYDLHAAQGLVYMYCIDLLPENLMKLNLSEYWISDLLNDSVPNITSNFKGIFEPGNTKKFYVDFRTNINNLKKLIEIEQENVYPSLIDHLITSYEYIWSKSNDKIIKDALIYLTNHRADVIYELSNTKGFKNNFGIRNIEEVQAEKYTNLYKLHLIVQKQMIGPAQEYFETDLLCQGYKYLCNSRSEVFGASILACTQEIGIDEDIDIDSFSLVSKLEDFVEIIQKLNIIKKYKLEILEFIDSDAAVVEYASNIIGIFEYTNYLMSRNIVGSTKYVAYAGIPFLTALAQYYDGPLKNIRIAVTLITLTTTFVTLYLIYRYITLFNKERIEVVSYINQITKELGMVNTLFKSVKPQYIIGMFGFIFFALLLIVSLTFRRRRL